MSNIVGSCAFIVGLHYTAPTVFAYNILLNKYLGDENMYYIQRERKIDDVIGVQSIVEFDKSIALSETESEVENEENDKETILEPDFEYNEDGSIDILRSGVFVISWFVTQMTGLAKNGQSFHIQKIDYDVGPTEWVRISRRQ